MKLNEIVATFSDLDKAQAVEAKLEQARVPAKVLDQSKLQRFVFLSEPLACYRVLVSEADYEKAREFLKAADAQDHILQDEVHCLQCGSPHVDYPQYSRKFVTTTMYGMLFAFLHLIDKTFYCQECHHTWPVKDLLRPGADALNWPSKDRGLVKEERG
jgi:hypothetical protein